MTPRLISTREAERYLGGLHPSRLGVNPVENGLWDRKAIDAALDAASGLTLTISAGEPAHDAAAELAALSNRIQAHAPGRA
jgi:hypothetical protein